MVLTLVLSALPLGLPTDLLSSLLLLAELGAQIGQGWLFAKPLDAQAFRAIVEPQG